MADAQQPMDRLVALVRKMIHDPVMPQIPPEFAEVEGLAAVHEQMSKLRDVLDAFSRGDFSPDVRLRGVIARRLKTLQASLLHLCWQIQQVANGDFTQRVDFLGEFASSFNSMVEQLDTALTSLRHKEEELTRLTLALQHEVEQKAEALEALSKSEARFRYMAEHDVLTGVCNRRSFYDLAVMELELARKERQPCGLMIFDLDHFKRFNDTYGHLDGDAALRHVTQTIKSELRKQDILGRYGGEEF
ncbi:MAG: GGDEF domain-containing protein, partial [Deltaproteobacteria bacterium]|nr:GGDEF domain-containing protein [Deltaproteobacteria bacterium]